MVDAAGRAAESAEQQLTGRVRRAERQLEVGVQRIARRIRIAAVITPTVTAT